MPNKFSVSPLGGFDLPGAITEATSTLVEERNLESLKQEAVEVFRSKDPNKVAEFMIENPEMQKHFESAVKYKNEATRKNVEESNIAILEGQDPITVVKKRLKFLRESGANPQQTLEFLQRLEADPDRAQEIAKEEAEYSLALRSPERYTAYRKAEDTSIASTKDRYKVVGSSLVDLKAKGGPKTVIKETQKPVTSLAKLKKDLANRAITADEYAKLSDKLLNPGAKNKTDLTFAALSGDDEAKLVLEEMQKADIYLAEEKGKAIAKGKFAAIRTAMDVPGVAAAILRGEEIIDNVKNTFGVPLQEIVRAEVLKNDPNFNFNQPRAVYSSLKSSLGMQEKKIGAMGSFVQNINDQVSKIEKMSQDVVARVGIRGLDVPWRKLNVKFIGSGNERVFEAFMKEISAEIQKLAGGSEASVAQLPEANRIEWEKIHDVNLPLSELIKVLKGTRDMANIRLKSVTDERARTVEKLKDVRGLGSTGQIEISSPDDPAYQQLPSGSTYMYNGKTYKKK